MEFDLRQYLRLALKWWWLLAIGVIVPVAVSYYYTSQQDPVYQAQVTLMVGTTLQSSNPNAREIGLAERLARTYAAMVKYRPVTEPVVRRLGLQRSPEALADQIVASVQPAANLLVIRVTDRNPRAAALIANAVAEELIRQSPASMQGESEQQEFIEQQLNDLKTKISEVEKEIEEKTAELVNLTSAAEIQAAQEYIASQESVASRYRSAYALYLQSYTGSSVNQLAIIEPAVERQRPVGGKETMVLGIAGLAGMGLALAAVLLIEYMDDTLRWSGSPEETLFDLPVLGAIARMPTSKGALIARIRDHSPEAEALRALRTTILLRRPRQPYRTLLITSPESREGKSFSSANLSVGMAAAGLRTILVDADMRKPSLHEVFDQPNVFGLSNLLQRTTPRADIETLKGLQETGLANLWLLSAGQPPLDPTVLLTSPNLASLMECLCQHADLVIFDSTPVLIMPDATILASEVEATLLILSHGLTTRTRLKKTIKALNEYERVNLAGVIFNQVRLRGGAYAYYSRKTRRRSRLGRVWQRLTFQKEGAQVADTDPDRLLGLSEAANLLGINKASARRWSKAGRLPVVKKGWRLRVRQGDLQTLIVREVVGRSDLTPPSDGNGQDGLSRQSTLVGDSETVSPVRQSVEG